MRDKVPESIVRDLKCVCSNCLVTGISEGVDGDIATILNPMPKDWAKVTIMSNKGILTNSLLCDLCLAFIKNAFSLAREARNS